MKKIATMLIILISISILNADVIGDLDPYEPPIIQDKTYKMNSYYDCILQPTIEYSQENYKVGDIIDITIHLEVNTKLNTDNMKFVITDYKNKLLYTFFTKETYNKITQDIAESLHEKDYDDQVLRLIESDADLVLSNEQPIGKYNIKFELTKKVIKYDFFDEFSSFTFCQLDLFAFKKAERYRYITDYGMNVSSLRIPIKVHPDALKDEKPSQKLKIKGYPQELPKRTPKKMPANKLEGKNRNGERPLELSVLSGQTTDMAFIYEPVTIIDYPTYLGNLSIVYDPNYGDYVIRINANTYYHNNTVGEVIYGGYNSSGIWTEFYFDVRIIYSYDLSGNIRMSYLNLEYPDGKDGNGVMELVHPNGSYEECLLDINGNYELSGFHPNDHIRYVSRTDEAMIIENNPSFGVIVSNYQFNLTPQRVYEIINYDKLISLEEAKQLLSYEDYKIFRLWEKSNFNVSKVSKLLKLSYHSAHTRVYKMKRNLRALKLKKEGYTTSKDIIDYNTNKKIVKFIKMFVDKMNTNDLKSLHSYLEHIQIEKIECLDITRVLDYDVKLKIE